MSSAYKRWLCQFSGILFIYNSSKSNKHSKTKIWFKHSEYVMVISSFTVSLSFLPSSFLPFFLFLSSFLFLFLFCFLFLFLSFPFFFIHLTVLCLCRFPGVCRTPDNTQELRQTWSAWSKATLESGSLLLNKQLTQNTVDKTSRVVIRTYRKKDIRACKEESQGGGWSGKPH